MSQPKQGYTIRIKQFEGPFDLLLFFIERDEVDIMDIPIAKITGDFLDYIHTLEKLNLDVASEFILVAATLMRIKAKMLLPRPVLNEAGEEVDPREELALKLLEYKRFKEITHELWSLEDERRHIAPRGNTGLEIRQIATRALVDVELQSLSLYKLFRTFEEVIKKMEVRKRGPRHVVYKYEYNIEEQKNFIFARLQANKKSTFDDLFKDLRDRLHAIVTFLSLLELINAQEINIISGAGTNSFWIEKAA